jgi:hypothetical protein
MNTGGRGGPRQYYGLPHIADKRVFAAVMFALKMMGDGTPPAVANTRAANYYAVPVNEVAHYTGIAASNVRRRRSRSQRRP